LVLAWRDFHALARNNLHQPISCELWFYHNCAGLIMGAALDDLQLAIKQLLTPDHPS